MATDILAFWAPGPLEVVIVMMFALIFVAVPVVLIVLLVVHLSKSGKERQKLHMKMRELSEELRKTQEQMKGRGPSSSG